MQQFRRHARPLALAVTYAVAGGLWITFSDELGTQLFTSSSALTRFQTLKGMGFIAVSAVLLYLALLRPRRRPAPASPAALPADRSFSVSVLLTLLVMATALPLAALLGWSTAEESRNQRAAADTLLQRVATNTATEALAVVREQQALLRALAARPAVQQLDPAHCDPLLQEVLTLHATLLQVATFSAHGERVCGGMAGDLQPVDVAADWPLQIGRRGGLLIGRPLRDAAGAWRLPMLQAMTDSEGALRGVMLAVVAQSVLQPVVENPLPAGGAATIVDERGIVVARWPGGTEHTGKQVPALLAAWQARPDGVTSLSAINLDGVEVVYVMHPVGDTGWLSSAGVPVKTIYAPARRALLQHGTIALLAIATCLWLVILLSRTISRPLEVLQRTAERAARGDFAERVPVTGPAELAAVAAGFNHMLDRLPALQRELVESETAHRTLIHKLSQNVPGMLYEFCVAPGRPPYMPFTSDRIREMFELAPQDVAEDASALLARLHPEDQQAVAATLEHSRSGLQPLSQEFRVILPRQGLRHYLSQAQPEPAGDGVVRWYGCTIDITPLKESQRALQELNDSLEQRIARRTAALESANEALEAFSYSVAHELRAPLDAISGFSQTIPPALARGDTARAQALNARVAANAERMSRLIRGFLSLAHAGRTAAGVIVMDTERMVREVLAEQRGAERVQVTLGPLPPVRADATTMRQVWTNLIGNAVKYSAKHPQPTLEIGCECRGDDLVFHVRDNGAGFDPAYQDRLFRPFQRLHSAQEFEGNGVGLALVQRILAGHDGRIWAQSRPGEGATFFFSLPASRLAPAPTQDGAMQQSAEAPPPAAQPQPPGETPGSTAAEPPQ